MACENGNIVTDLLEGLSLETHQLDLLTRFGILDANPDALTLLGRIKAVRDELTTLNSSFVNEDFASETTLQSNLTALNTIITKLTTLITESNDTQALIGDVSATPTANTVLGRLKDIYEAVDGLELSVDNIDLNTDQLETLITATNQAVADLHAANDLSGDDIVIAVDAVSTAVANLQASNTSDSADVQAKVDAVKASIDVFKTAFDSRDLATESTLSTLKAEFNDAFPGSTRDTNNETTTSPGSGGNYTGTFTDIRHYGSALVLVVSDVALDSAVLEWSDDGVAKKPSTLVGDTTLTLAETAGLFVYFAFIEQQRNGYFYRINATATATAPTIFETISYLKKDQFVGSFSDATAALSLQNRYLLTRSIQSIIDTQGAPKNLRGDVDGALLTTLDGVTVSPSGALHTEGFLDYHSLDFGVEEGPTDILKLQEVAVEPNDGTYAIDPVNGGLVVQTAATPGSTEHIETIAQTKYAKNTGHGVMGEKTIIIEDISGLGEDGFIEWGYGKYIDTGGGPKFDGFGYGYDKDGFYVFLKKEGVYIYKQYKDLTGPEDGWNGDSLDGNENSLFQRSGTPEAIDIMNGNLFRIESEFLYFAEQTYKVKRPTGKFLTGHVHQYVNHHAFTSLRSANLPMFLHVHNDTTTGGILKIRSGSWHGGVYTSKQISTGRDANGEFTDVRTASILDSNSLYGTLGPNAETGFAGFLSEDYPQANVTFISDQPSALKGIKFYYSHTGEAGSYFEANSAFTHKGTAESRKTEDGLSGVRFFQIPLGIKYFKVFYKNGPTLANVSMQTAMLTSPTLTTIRRIGDDLDPDASSTNVVSVLAGAELDENLQTQPEALYPKVPVVTGGGLLTANPWREAFRDTFEESGPLPSGAYPTYDPVNPIVAANVIDTGWLNLTRFKDQFLNTIFNIDGVEAYVFNASDTLGNNSTFFGFGVPQYTSTAFFPDTVGAPFFGRYFRAIFVNTSGTTCTGYTIRSMGSDTPVGGVFQSLNAPIRSFFPAHVTQTVIKAESEVEVGSYEAIKQDGQGRILTNLGSQFSRLLGKQAEDVERIRMDAEPGTGVIYMGKAARGTAGSSPEWKVVRVKLSATLNPEDAQYAEDIAWDDRNNAAHWDTTA